MAAPLHKLSPRFAALLGDQDTDTIRQHMELANLSYAIAHGDLDSRWELGQAMARVLAQKDTL